MAAHDSEVGGIGWLDITVSDPTSICDFYVDVVGWVAEPFDSGFNMKAEDSGELIAGIAPRPREGPDLPPQWIPYIRVGDLERSVARCRESGGSLLVVPDTAADERYAVIRDPAGACLGLLAVRTARGPTA